MATNIKPLHDRVIVKRIEEGEQIRGGILIPDVAKEKSTEGEVVAVGEGARASSTGILIPMSVSVGDRVIFSKYGGTEIKVDGEDLLIVREGDILGVVVLAARGGQ